MSELRLRQIRAQSAVLRMLGCRQAPGLAQVQRVGKVHGHKSSLTALFYVATDYAYRSFAAYGLWV